MECVVDIDAVLAENERRKVEIASGEEFDPYHGIGCSGDRVAVGPEVWTDGVEMVPSEMLSDEGFGSVRSREGWVRLRCRYDFEYWAVMCARVKDKVSGRMVPFCLNGPQRRVVGLLEGDRRSGRPMRLIVLKARQWGASTVIEMYIAWMQTVRERHLHALVCAQNGNTSSNLLNLYRDLLASYPDELWEGDGRPKLTGTRSPVEVNGRDCRLFLGTSESVDAIRGADYALAHLTEVAFWKDSPRKKPSDFIRSICGGVALARNTLIVMESTANGVGNFFHSEWLRSQRGEGDKRPVFVGWWEIGIYSCELSGRVDAERLWCEMDDYERGLWDRGLTLEQINWYHRKRREYQMHAQMMAEYPTTAEEAFTNSANNVFAADAVVRLREGCMDPLSRGEVEGFRQTGPEALRGVVFREDSTGGFCCWEFPRVDGRYVVAVDVGGRSVHSDWSVIAVFFCGDGLVEGSADRTRVVGQWRGHIDHDLLTWKAAAIGRFYNDALLVFESNTLESGDGEGCSQGAYILNVLYEHYPNLYYRQSPDGGGYRPGFHTNRATKQMVITGLIAAVRDGLYVERDAGACDELSFYERRSNGSYGARSGRHDDCLMTRAIGLYVVGVCRVPDCASVAGDEDLAAYVAGF